MEDIKIVSCEEESGRKRLVAAMQDEKGTVLSKGSFTFIGSKFGKTFVKAMTAGGVATQVENRRGGNVRRIFDHMYRLAIEEGAGVSILHPFSFAYYNKFGYERVADHIIARFPTRLIDFVPRRCNFVPYREEMLSDMIRIYNEFAKGRNLLLARINDATYLNKQTYICYDGAEPIAYIAYTVSKTLAINHYTDTLLTVQEMAYTSPKGLYEIFSFLRMFEGEFDEIELRDCGIYTEVDLLLRHYTHTKYTILPDLSAKLLNSEIMLKANVYPEKEGAFTVRIEDDLPTVGGVYSVTYGGGEGIVKRLDNSADADLSITSASFTRLIYGYDPLDKASIKYLRGVEVYSDNEDIFRAFPKRACGIFEHF